MRRAEEADNAVDGVVEVDDGVGVTFDAQILAPGGAQAVRQWGMSERPAGERDEGATHAFSITGMHALEVPGEGRRILSGESQSLGITCPVQPAGGGIELIERLTARDNRRFVMCLPVRRIAQRELPARR